MEKIQFGSKKALFQKDFYENTAWQGKMIVCGIDEVGRGCLAGPLVTGAVILPSGCNYQKLKDSKLMTQKEREIAYHWIIKNCWFGTGIVSNQTIDRHNIWQSTLIAMKKAVLNLLASCPDRPAAILVDAIPLELLDTNYKNIPIFHFDKGESKSSSIAAASIVAKVTRDKLMSVFENVFPGYNLSQHKGYGTKKHKDAIKILGHTIIHRTSFLGKTIGLEKNEKQASIF